jgi:multiple sugar transport system permease protein
MKIKKVKISQAVVNIIILSLLFIMLYPLAMTLWGAFKNSYNFDVSKWYPTIPIRITNLLTAFPLVFRYILNTFFVAVVGTFGSLIIAALSAYAFARMNFMFKNLLYFAVISLMMIPGVLTLVPSYMLYQKFFGLDNYLILIMPTIVGGPIFGIFLLRSFYEGLPEAVFESARIDGAKEFTVFRKICVPMSIPIMGTLSIMQIISIWNDYMWPIITIRSDSLLTISAGLIQRFSTFSGTPNYPVTFSSYIISSIPLIFLFVFANKFYIEGLTSSSIKL